MIITLRIIFSLILLTMIVVTTTSSLLENMFKIPAVVTSDCWFRATLFDAYFGFLTFYCWVFYKERERGWISRVIWFILIMLLGNMAMAAYMLIKLFKISANDSIALLLLNERAANGLKQ